MHSTWLLVFAASLSFCTALSFPSAEQSALYENDTDDLGGGITRLTNKSPRCGYDGPGVPNLFPFDDVESILNTTGQRVVGMCAIHIRFGDSVDAIQGTYLLSNGSCYKAPRRGGKGGQPFTIKLDVKANEYVTKIEGSTKGSVVNHIAIHTFRPGYERRVFGPFGKPGNFNFSIEGYIIGLYGRHGALVETIGAYYLEHLKRSPLYGVQPAYEIAASFDDMLAAQVPPVVGISKIQIWHGKKINAFQVDYLLLSGKTLRGEKHGGDGTLPAKLTTIVFKNGEKIVRMYGKTDRNYFTYLDQVSFVTKNKYGSLKTYGPFGLGKIFFYSKVDFSGNISGFFGSLSIYVYGFGAYYL